MGRVFVRKLEGEFYSCKFCKTHLVHADHIISRAFQSRRGKAYLVSSVVNVTYGPHEERMMLSGMHTVADVYCISCGQIIGWKYEASPDETQKYKEGKYVLERARMVDNSDTEFSIDTHPGTSDDGEDSEVPA